MRPLERKGEPSSPRQPLTLPLPTLGLARAPSNLRLSLALEGFLGWGDRAVSRRTWPRRVWTGMQVGDGLGGKKEGLPEEGAVGQGF